MLFFMIDRHVLVSPERVSIELTISYITNALHEKIQPER